MPRSGKPFSVRMTNSGPLGWVSDIDGYRYQATHPETGSPWPPMPDALMAAWRELSGLSLPSRGVSRELLLGRHSPGFASGPATRMSLPLPSSRSRSATRQASGSAARSARMRHAAVKLASGDAFVFGGVSRLAFHGIDRVLPRTSTLLAEGGRFNLTMRRVTPAK